MLTCEQIAQQARRISSLIDRQNYDAVAEQIHPRIMMAASERGSLRRDIPEWQEYRQGQKWNTEDWTDMVVSTVTLWQWRAASKQLSHTGNQPQSPVNISAD